MQLTFLKAEHVLHQNYWRNRRRGHGAGKHARVGASILQRHSQIKLQYIVSVVDQPPEKSALDGFSAVKLICCQLKEAAATETRICFLVLKDMMLINALEGEGFRELLIYVEPITSSQCVQLLFAL